MDRCCAIIRRKIEVDRQIAASNHEPHFSGWSMTSEHEFPWIDKYAEASYKQSMIDIENRVEDGRIVLTQKDKYGDLKDLDGDIILSRMP